MKKKIRKVSGGNSRWTEEFKNRNGSDTINNLSISKDAKIGDLTVSDRSTSSIDKTHKTTVNKKISETNINWLHIG